MAQKIKALIFDIFGTVVDWRTGVARHVEGLLREKKTGIDPLDFADAWRDRYQPAMEAIRSAGRHYVSLDVLHRENLDHILDGFGLAGRFDDDERNRMNRAWERLPAWEDSAPGIEHLRSRYLVAPCSNGSIGMMARLARYAGIEWDAVLGADIARAYKPMHEVYLASASALDLDPGEVVMVAAHNSDLAAASECGLQTAFLPRPLEHGAGGKNEQKAEKDWNYCASDIKNLAEILTT